MPILTRTDKPSLSSVLSLINPVSSVTGTADYVPDKVLNIGRKLWGGQTNKYSDRLSHLIFKTGITAGTAAAIVGIARVLQHANDIHDASMNGAKLRKQFSSVRQPILSDNRQVDKKAALNKKAGGAHWSSLDDASAYIPPAAFLLAAMLTYRTVDKIADRSLGGILKSNIKDNKRKINDLMIARRNVATGNMDTPQVRAALSQIGKNASLIKQANILDIGSRVGAAAALLYAAILGGSGYAAYKLGQAQNQNRARYKAAKQALNAFAKQKNVHQTIDHAPVSQQVLAKLNKGVGKKQTDLPSGLLGAAASVQL